MMTGRKKMRNAIAPRHSQSGLAMVETVISIPLVILIMLGVAEIGNAVLQYNALTQHVRDGARYISANADQGSTNTVLLTTESIANTANVVAYGQVAAGSPLLPGLSAGNVTVTDLGNGNISVSVSYNYQPLFVSGIPSLVQGGRIGGNLTMNVEVIVRGLV
jgi:Flp pilus assembly protein TadG